MNIVTTHSAKPLLCKDCTWSARAQGYRWCTHPAQRSRESLLVEGRRPLSPLYWEAGSSCERMRQEGWLCGPEGKLYEEGVSIGYRLVTAFVAIMLLTGLAMAGLLVCHVLRK